MPVRFDFSNSPEQSYAQLEALRQLSVGLVGSVGEAAVGTYVEETIVVTDMQEDEESGEPMYRDFDVLATQALPIGWQKENPEALGPHPLDGSIHAKLSGGMRAELQVAFGMREPLVDQITMPEWPLAERQLVERRTADGHVFLTPRLGVLKAIRLAFQKDEEFYGADAAQQTAGDRFFARLETAALPEDELLSDRATAAIIQRFNDAQYGR